MRRAGPWSRIDETAAAEPWGVAAHARDRERAASRAEGRRRRRCLVRRPGLDGTGFCRGSGRDPEPTGLARRAHLPRGHGDVVGRGRREPHFREPDVSLGRRRAPVHRRAVCGGRACLDSASARPGLSARPAPGALPRAGRWHPTRRAHPGRRTGSPAGARGGGRASARGIRGREAGPHPRGSRGGPGIRATFPRCRRDRPRTRRP